MIEVDGDQHLNQTAQDETRDNSLIANGYKVLRFSTAEIWNESNIIIQKIANVLQENIN